MAEIQETPGPTTGVIELKQIKSPAEIADEAAKILVINDARQTRSWINSRFFQIRWIEEDFQNDRTGCFIKVLQPLT